MDNKLIKEYGQQIACYRLRSARSRKRAAIEDFEKYLIALHKEEKQLTIKKRNTGWQQLDPPIQRGWKRTFVLSENTRMGENAVFFQQLLDLINTKDWSHRRDFMIRQRKNGKKIYSVSDQRLRRFHPIEFSKMGFSESVKGLFYKESYWEKWSKDPYTRYVFKEPWRFVLRIQPNIITQVKTRDHLTESRLEQINNQLEKTWNRLRQFRLVHGHGKYKYWKKSLKAGKENGLKNKTLIQIIDRLRNENAEQ